MVSDIHFFDLAESWDEELFFKILDQYDVNSSTIMVADALTKSSFYGRHVSDFLLAAGIALHDRVWSPDCSLESASRAITSAVDCYRTISSKHPPPRYLGFWDSLIGTSQLAMSGDRVSVGRHIVSALATVLGIKNRWAQMSGLEGVLRLDSPTRSRLLRAIQPEEWADRDTAGLAASILNAPR